MSMCCIPLIVIAGFNRWVEDCGVEPDLERVEVDYRTLVPRWLLMLQLQRLQ